MKAADLRPGLVFKRRLTSDEWRICLSAVPLRRTTPGPVWEFVEIVYLRPGGSVVSWLHDVHLSLDIEVAT